MADISAYTSRIASATYGKDVRQSIIDALNKVSNDYDTFNDYQEQIVKAYTLLQKCDTTLAELAAESITAISNLNELRAENFNSEDILKGVAYLKATLGLFDSDVLGVEIDLENKTFTRLCGAVGLSAGEDFDGFSMYGGRQRCNLADDGTVTAYYGDDAYTEIGYLEADITDDDGNVAYASGTAVQVMVEQPVFYYLTYPTKIEKQAEGGVGYHIRKMVVYVSETQYSGFKRHPAFYDTDGNEIDKVYLGAYEGSVWDADKTDEGGDYLYNDEQVAQFSTDLFCSIAGVKPASGLTQTLTRPNVELMCKNRGDGWHTLNAQLASIDQLLMIVEFATLNTQTGSGSNGVVSITDNTSYNCSSLTGSTADLGNASGQAAETINEINGTKTTYDTNGKTAYSYRGVENPWGNIWKHIIGVNIWGDGAMNGGVPYICTDFNYAESKRTDNYESAGFSLTNANGYVSAFGYSATFDWLLMPSETSGNSSLPVGDYAYVTSLLNGYRIARLGGHWYSSVSAGAFYWNCDAGVGFRGRNIGGRLVYVPSATDTEADAA